MRLRQSRIEGYGPRPQAHARLARAAVVPPASAYANWNRKPLRTPACVARWDLLEVGNFAPFSEFLHIKGRNFPDVFYHVYLWPL